MMTSMYSVPRVLKGIRSLVFGPAYLRRRVALEISRVLTGLWGWYLGDDYKLWLKDDRFSDKFKQLSPHNYFSMERKFALKEFARSVHRLPGDIAECGSYVGVAAWFVANELRDADFFLFDSFEGLSEPVVQDTSPAGIQQWKEGDLRSAKSVLELNLKEFKNIHIMQGWIPERFAEVEERRFKLVHIDVDLYQPTLDSLSFFYDRMVEGGVIVMDDYGFENCLGAYRAANEFFENRPECIIHLPTGQGVVIIC